MAQGETTKGTIGSVGELMTLSMSVGTGCQPQRSRRPLSTMVKTPGNGNSRNGILIRNSSQRLSLKPQLSALPTS